MEAISVMRRLSELLKNELLCLLPLYPSSTQGLLLMGPALELCLWVPYNYVSTAWPVRPTVNRVIWGSFCNVSNCCVVDIQCMCLSLTHRPPFQLESFAFHVETLKEMSLLISKPESGWEGGVCLNALHFGDANRTVFICSPQWEISAALLRSWQKRVCLSCREVR